MLIGQGDGDTGEAPSAERRANPLPEGWSADVARHAALLTVYELSDAGVNGDAASSSERSAASKRDVVVADRREVERYVQAPPERVRRRYMKGDAMGATITPGAACYCVPVERFEGHGIYYLTVDGHPMIARVQLVGGGAWLVKYDNESYEDEMFAPAEEGGEDAYVSKLSGRVVRLRILERVRSFVVES